MPGGRASSPIVLRLHAVPSRERPHEERNGTKQDATGELRAGGENRARSRMRQGRLRGVRRSPLRPRCAATRAAGGVHPSRGDLAESFLRSFAGTVRGRGLGNRRPRRGRRRARVLVGTGPRARRGGDASIADLWGRVRARRLPAFASFGTPSGHHGECGALAAPYGGPGHPLHLRVPGRNQREHGVAPHALVLFTPGAVGVQGTAAASRSLSRSSRRVWILHTRDSDRCSTSPISRRERSSQ